MPFIGDLQLSYTDLPLGVFSLLSITGIALEEIGEEQLLL